MAQVVKRLQQKNGDNAVESDAILFSAERRSRNNERPPGRAASSPW
jgi:hypothetical protein